MPELPEVETMRRGVLGVVGCRVGAVRLPKSRLRPIQVTPRAVTFRRRVVGCTIVGIDRVGKRVVIELDSEDRIVIEPRMTGRVLLVDSPDAEHVRLVLELAGRTRQRLLFWDRRGLGVVSLLSPRQFAARLGPDKIGPDALEITAGQLCERLSSSRRAIKVALLDQAALAGIGNLYASEILHRAGVHPESECNSLRASDWRRLHVAIGQVLEEAISCQGSTLSDGTYRTASDEAGAFQGRHRVYQRAGQRCRQCDRAEIVRVVQAQRSTFFCPVCQRRRKR